jgi:hypothetical protein
MLFAVYRVEGGIIERDTVTQYASHDFANPHALASGGAPGQQVPVAQALPGDLLYWSTDPACTTADAQAAIVVDDDTMITVTEATNAVVLTQRYADADGVYLMPLAIRYYP